MKFLNEITEDEFFLSLERGINKNASFEDSLEDNRLSSVLALLSEAEKKLRHAGLKKAAQQVAVVHKVVQDDKNPEHYIQNLLQHGMMQDLDCNNDSGPDTSSCSEGEQPQLSQDELVRLRSLLKTEDKEHAPEKPKEESKEKPKEDSKKSDEKSNKDDKDDKNDIQAVVKNQTGGEMNLDMTPEETKQVLSHRKSLLKELSALL